MSSGPHEIHVPRLTLNHCDVAEYCRALQSIRDVPYWWYLGKSRVFGNFSVPFQDSTGGWWYQVKPGLCWPADVLRVRDSHPSLPFTKSFLGLQCVSREDIANAAQVINTITDLEGYGSSTVNSKRRNAIRKGSRSCEITTVPKLDDSTAQGACDAWNSLVGRTGWKSQCPVARLRQEWNRLLQLPGTTILIGTDTATGRIAGFLITKILGDTAYVDTIASHSELLSSNVNDILMYAFLVTASKIPGIKKAHFAIKSYDERLEKFKTSLGFVPNRYASCTVLRPGVGLLLRLADRNAYNRLFGNI